MNILKVALTTTDIEGSIMTTFCDPLILLTTGPYGKKILKWLVFEYSFFSLTFELTFGLNISVGSCQAVFNLIWWFENLVSFGSKLAWFLFISLFELQILFEKN